MEVQVIPHTLTQLYNETNFLTLGKFKQLKMKNINS